MVRPHRRPAALPGQAPRRIPEAQKRPRTGKWNAPREIEEAFRRLMMGGAPAVADDEPVVAVLDAFIDWCVENRAGKTADRYKDFIQDFVRSRDGKGLPFGSLAVTTLTSKHVTVWLGQHPTWNSTTKRNAITALQRGFNWATKNRGLARNPIKGMEKPGPPSPMVPAPPAASSAPSPSASPASEAASCCRARPACGTACPSCAPSATATPTTCSQSSFPPATRRSSAPWKSSRGRRNATPPRESGQGSPGEAQEVVRARDDFVAGIEDRRGLQRPPRSGGVL
jgi:hypothetical protein